MRKNAQLALHTTQSHFDTWPNGACNWLLNAAHKFVIRPKEKPIFAVFLNQGADNCRQCYTCLL